MCLKARPVARAFFYTAQEAILKILFCTLLLLYSFASHAADPWVAAAKVVQRDAFFQALPVKVTVPSKPVKDSPTSVRLNEDGSCTLMLQHRNNPHADAMAELAPAPVRSVFLQAIVAHEFAHCWRQQDSPERMAEVIALLERAQKEPALAESALHAKNQEEIFSDVAALAWVEKRYPEEYPQVLQTFVKLRADSRFTAQVHDTRAALDRILAYGMIYGDTPFHSADTTLAALRPGKVWRTRPHRTNRCGQIRC